MPRKPKSPAKPRPKNSKGWTPERRAAQAERCRINKPSQHSTGPKTDPFRFKHFSPMLHF